MHETFQTLVRPSRRVPKRITEITGITEQMVRADGLELPQALAAFRDFVGDLPLVAFNAEFDDAFLRAACAATSTDPFTNEVCCALQLSRRAWPWRKSFRLADIDHAAVTNKDDAPMGHVFAREKKGLRPGGFGILMSQSLADELLYNEAQNEVVFVKYLDGG